MAVNLNQVVYLEQYIETCYFLPTELQRMVNTIKALDDKCAELSDGLATHTAQLLAMPPLHQQPDGPSEEYRTVMKKVEVGQKMLAQFADEKVQLAQQAYDIIEMHALELEKQMENFESDLRVGGMDADLGLEQGSYAEVYTPATLADLETQVRGRTPRGDDSVWGMPTPAEKRKPTSSTVGAPYTPSVAPSAAGPSGAGGAAAVVGIKRSASASAPASGGSTKITLPVKRMRPDDGPAATPLAAPAAAAAAAVATTPAVAVAPPPPPFPAAVAPPVAPPPPAVTPAPPPPPITIAPAPPPPPLPPAGASTERKKEKKGVAAAATPPEPVAPADGQTATALGFKSLPPPGIVDSAPTPQVPGHFLSHSDITPALKGRLAELFWPADDSSGWYLIEIQEVDVGAKHAKILYSTGEAEELDLEEIVTNHHMTLLPASKR